LAEDVTMEEPSHEVGGFRGGPQSLFEAAFVNSKLVTRLAIAAGMLWIPFSSRADLASLVH